jgi:hypothetical protein
VEAPRSGKYRRMRTGVVLVALCLLAAAPSTGATAERYWSSAKLLHKLDTARVVVGGRTVRIRSATTLCAGRGTSIRRRGIRLWSRFVCTYTTFTKGGVDRDLDFRVRIRSASRFTLWDVHWVRGPRATG